MKEQEDPALRIFIQFFQILTSLDPEKSVAAPEADPPTKLHQREERTEASVQKEAGMKHD